MATKKKPNRPDEGSESLENELRGLIRDEKRRQAIESIGTLGVLVERMKDDPNFGSTREKCQKKLDRLLDELVPEEPAATE
jgi:hypothetical protein